MEIASHARLRSKSGRPPGDDFAIVFAGIGVPYDSAEFFRRSLEECGALERTALFLNLASDSSTQRLLTPRFALTAAEYLAFVEGKHAASPAANRPLSVGLSPVWFVRTPPIV